MTSMTSGKTFHTVAIVTALFAGRYLLVALRGEARWAVVAARWMRRVAIVAVILLLLRLASIGVMRPEIGGPIAWLVLAILAAGAAILMIDHILIGAIRPLARRKRP